MRNFERILEIEALTENVVKHFANNNLLRIKILFFIDEYKNFPVSTIITKLGIKKSNFALMSKTLEKEGLVVSKEGDLDRRCRLLYLTEEGEKVLNEFNGKMASFFDDNDKAVTQATETLLDYLNKKI